MNLPRSFAIVRTKSGESYVVSATVGNRLRDAWLAPGIEDQLVAHDFLELSGAEVSLETDSIESVRQTTIDQAKRDREIKTELELINVGSPVGP